MKQLSTFILSLFFLSAGAQSASTVTIHINGNNNNPQVTIDNGNYTDNNPAVDGSHTDIIIKEMQGGQHSLIISDKEQTNKENDINTIFYTRPGFDMLVTINTDGTVQTKETKAKIRREAKPATMGTAMSESSFNNLFEEAQGQSRAASKMTLVTTAFNDPNNFFTTNQAGQLIQLFSSETDRLKLAKLSYRSIVDPENFTQLTDLLNSQSSKDDLIAFSKSSGSDKTSTTGKPSRSNKGRTRSMRDEGENGTNTRTAMTDAQFNAILTDVKKYWMTNDRVASATKSFAITTNYFSTYQVRQVIQLINGESNRLQLAKQVYPNIVDPDNFSQLYDLLSTQVAKDDLSNYVQQYSRNDNNDRSANNNNKVAMTDASFYILLGDIKKQWLPGARMTSLRNAFSNTTNYFTLNQIRELIGLVTDEKNRLELAKAAYKNAVNTDDYLQLADLFSTQSSKNDLAAYINDYNRRGR